MCDNFDEKILERYYCAKEGALTRYNDDMYKRTANDQFAWIIKSIKLSKIQSIFEVGCGKGYLLSKFRKKMNGENIIIKGLEPDPIAVNFGKEELGLDIDVGVIEHYKNTRKYDLVLISHVLEHVINPIEFIKKIKDDLLSADGKMFCEVPSIITEVPTYSIEHGILEYFTGVSAEEHIFAYSKDALNKLFARLDFNIVKVEDCSSFFIKELSKSLTNIDKSGKMIQTKPEDENFVLKCSFSAIYNSLRKWVLVNLYLRFHLLKNSGLRILVKL